MTRSFGRRLQPLLRRARWIGLSAIAGLVSAFAVGAPPAVSVEGLLGWLGEQTQLSVRPEDLRWAPSSGYLGDLILGRRLLFLASEQPGGKRDLYRARVRLADGGQPLTMSGLRNLTRTPLGDDAGIEVVGERAVWATMAYGKVQAVSIAELDGIRTEDLSGGAFLGFLRGLTNLQMAGCWSGIGRTDIVMHTPVQQVELTLGGEKLRVKLGSGQREFDYDLNQRTARAPDSSQAHGVRVVPNCHPPKPFVLWAVDSVREEVGPEPIAWLEDKVFGVRSLLRLAAFRMTASSEERALVEGEAAAPPMLDASQLGSNDMGWPPPNVASLYKQTEPGEGVWIPVELPFLRPSLARTDSGEKPPPYFYQTFTRPDPKRPYAKLWLVAMDMRQLELGMQAGFEDPEPLTGPAGDGRLPDDKHTLERVVATFNGAFKTEHGKYGMMAQRRVLLPPVPGGATVAVDNEREVWLGSWPKSEHIPESFVSFRQNLDPLVEDGVANPTGRQLWGWQLEGKSVLTERTGLCVTPAGHVYYAWGEEIDGPMLGQALRQVGCNYGMHLDMNPGHCGFVFARVDDWQKHQFSLKHAVPKMSIPIDRYMRWSPKDFFYVALRDPNPPPVERGAARESLHWALDLGTQPPPSWWPGIFHATTEYAGQAVELWSFERGRFDWTVRAGTREPNEIGAAMMKTALTGDEAHRVLAAIGLAYTTKATRLGLGFDGKASIPMRPKMATLVMRPGESLVFGADAIPPMNSADAAVQLPLLALRGEITAEGRAQGPMRERAALCVTAGQRVIVGRSRNDTAFPLVNTLLSLGCKDVADLDRGSSDPSFMHRSGTDLPPTGDYETTVLYVLGRPMTPHANRWKPDGATASKTPTGYDLPHRK